MSTEAHLHKSTTNHGVFLTPRARSSETKYQYVAFTVMD
jgi:hypothetical protein